MYLPSSKLYVTGMEAAIVAPESSSGTVKSTVIFNVHPEVCGTRNLRFLDNNLSLFRPFLNCVEEVIGRIEWDITNARK